MREAFTQAKDYQRTWDEYNEKVKKGDKTATPPKKDLKLDALVQVLQGKMLVQIHCYRADEFLTEIAIANEFGYKIRAFHHALEAYKVPEALAKNDIAIATFADWWGFKYEAWDAIPWNAVIAMRAGVRVAIKSDSEDYMRRLNQEAAKTMRYGGATEDEAMKMLTINPAWIMGVEDKTGSIDVGKDADLVLWDGYPLSSYGVPDESLDRRRFVFRPQPSRPRHAELPGGRVMTRTTARIALLVSLLMVAAVRATKVRRSRQSRDAGSDQTHRHHWRQAVDHHSWHDRQRRAGHRERQDRRRGRGWLSQGSGQRAGYRRQGHDRLSRADRLGIPPRPHRNRGRQDDQRPRRTQRRDHAAHACGRRIPCRVRAHSCRPLQRHHQRDCRPRQPRYAARPGFLHPARRG